MSGAIMLHKVTLSKARSIVAMLFWEWRKDKRLFGKNDCCEKTSIHSFQQAYKMLKDNQ